MANFFYYDKTNQKQGPVSEQQLKELAKQGVIGPHTPMVTDTGHKGVAGQIPGLFPAASVQEPQPVPVPLVAPPPPPPVNLFCTNCGNSVSEKAVACMSCGAKPIGHKKFCRPCGVALNPEQVVCVKCGAEVKAGAFQSFPLNTAAVFQSFGDNMNTLPHSFRTITIGEIVIVASAVLACLSFFLPWQDMQIATKNGFSTGAFLFGLVFVYPAWEVLARKQFNKIFGYLCAGIGICSGIFYAMYGATYYPSAEVARHFSSSPTYYGGIGIPVFIVACIALIVGITMKHRPFK